MSARPFDGDFSSEIGQHVARLLFERAHPLSIHFDSNWKVEDVRGEASWYGLDFDDPESGVRQLQDLFLGMPVDDNIDLPFVQMANGRSAHVHLMANVGGFQVLLLDAQSEHDRQREQQQIGNEAVLVGYQKSKALVRLRQIRTELEQQRAKLLEANALKNALIATLSHDFRTPLTSIFGYLHLLDNKPLDEAGKQSLRAVRRNAHYLFALAENLLEYGRADSGVAILNPVATDLPALAEDLDAMFRPIAAEQGLELNISLERDNERTPVLDEMRLRQVLVNLLSNAIRYTLSGSVSVRLEWRDRTLNTEVCDTGIGIPDDLREKVFVAFNSGGRAGSTGAGLGLSIVKRLVTLMHGTLTLESELGKGTCFRISLPALGQIATASEIDAAKDASSTWSAGYSALVVDDDPDIAYLLAALLDDLGFSVKVTGDATSAVEMAMASPPDLLLIDVELPGLSGNTAVYRLRAQGYKGRVLTLSATPTEEARDAAMNAGADEYMTKPINIENFVRTTQRLVRER
jgi:signal transduction histidine kinase